MAADVMTRLNQLKAQIEKGKTEKAKAEANLATYTKQYEEVKAEIVALGVEPTEEALTAEIARLDGEILANLTRAEELLWPEGRK